MGEITKESIQANVARQREQNPIGVFSPYSEEPTTEEDLNHYMRGNILPPIVFALNRGRITREKAEDLFQVYNAASGDPITLDEFMNPQPKRQE